MSTQPAFPPRLLPGLVSLGAVVALVGGAFAGLIAEGARDWDGALSAFDG